MKIKYNKANIKNLVIPVVALMLLAGVTYGSSQALADDDPSTGSGQSFSPIVQRLVERFNLNEDEVGEVLEEFRGQHHWRIQERMEERLAQLVNSGELTETQKQAILDKHAEMKAEHEELMTKWSSMTEDERLAAHEAHKDQLEAWAEENGIDLSEILGSRFFKGGFGHHRMMGRS